MNDIEQRRSGWIPSLGSKDACEIENPEHRFNIKISHDRFIFSTDNIVGKDIGEVAKEVNSIWKLVKSNLGLHELTKVGIGFQFLLPTDSKERSEDLLAKSQLNVSLPRKIIDSGFALKARNITITLEKDLYEYTISLGGAVRTEAVNPTKLMQIDVRALSKNQRLSRSNQIKQLSQYRADPMFGVILAINCVIFAPKTFSIEEDIATQYEIVRLNFFEILEKL